MTTVENNLPIKTAFTRSVNKLDRVELLLKYIIENVEKVNMYDLLYTDPVTNTDLKSIDEIENNIIEITKLLTFIKEKVPKVTNHVTNDVTNHATSDVTNHATSDVTNHATSDVEVPKIDIPIPIIPVSKPKPKPKMYGLLVGCDYEGTPNELKGCSKDVMDVRTLLNDKDYKTRVLCDDTDRNMKNIIGNPTFNNLRTEINYLINMDNPDKLFFHYSGHGIYTTDTSKDEKDFKDEMIVCSDNTFVSDDILNQMFSGIPKCKMFFLMDCCHSGTILDFRYRMGDDGKDILEHKTDTMKCDAVMISGCRDIQTSADAFMNNSYRGAMSTAFLNAYNSLGTNITVKVFVEHMRLFLKKNKYNQVPQVSYTIPNGASRIISEFIA